MNINMSGQIFLAHAYLCLWLPGAAGWLFHLCVYVWWICLVHYSAVKFQWQQAVMVMTSLGHDYCSGPGWRCGHIVTVASSVVVSGPFVCGDWVSVGWHCFVVVIVDECSDVVGCCWFQCCWFKQCLLIHKNIAIFMTWQFDILVCHVTTDYTDFHRTLFQHVPFLYSLIDWLIDWQLIGWLTGRCLANSTDSPATVVSASTARAERSVGELAHFLCYITDIWLLILLLIFNPLTPTVAIWVQL